jgi:hypothetical protein
MQLLDNQYLKQPERRPFILPSLGEMSSKTQLFHLLTFVWIL